MLRSVESDNATPESDNATPESDDATPESDNATPESMFVVKWTDIGCCHRWCGLWSQILGFDLLRSQCFWSNGLI